MLLPFSRYENLLDSLLGFERDGSGQQGRIPMRYMCLPHPVVRGAPLALLLQHLRDLPRAECGALHMDAVDLGIEPLVLIGPCICAIRRSCACHVSVGARPAHAEQLACALPREPFRKVACRSLTPWGRIRSCRKTAGGSRARR